MKRFTALAFLAALMTMPVLAQDKKEDPLADIKAQIKDPAKPFTMIVEFKVKPDSMKEFKKLVREAVKHTRKEEGNAAYQVHADSKDPNTLVFFEIWRSVAALETHVGFDYTKNLLGKVGELCEGPPSIRVLTPSVPDTLPKPKAAGEAPKAEAKPAEAK